MHLTKIITIILLVFFSASYSGQKTKNELDSLFSQKVKMLFEEGKLDESLVVCKEVISGYEQLNEDKSALKAYVRAANICSNLFRTKESLQYLDIAAEKNAAIKDKYLESRINGGYGRNYQNLGFNDLALKYYDKAISIAEKNNDKINLEYFYGLQSVIYEEQKEINKLYRSLTKAHKSRPTVYNSARLAKYFLSFRKNLDSAKFYLDLGEKMAATKKFPLFQESILQRNQGRYFMEKNDYAKAVFYLEKSLAISKQLNKPQDVKETHKMLAKAYKSLKDDEKSVQNLEKYTAITDSLLAERQKIQHLPIEKVIKEKEESSKKSFSKLYLIIFAIVLLFAVIYFISRKKFSAKSLEKEMEISLKEEENLQLQQKVNEKFDDIIQLAKNNSPEFFTRFQEIYPHVISNLLKVNPRLRVSELTLCAYIYLGFNTKDIANYTFRTISTVRNRKHNLRTKLNIPAEESTELWFKNIGNKLY
ncbi:tetratricopeptide repeat protein [Chryseobacterium binzhouense]|uniref:tetratricopeptide repeat protein n=1 Tax=Chryseobacterium binzhouense TaxID=2593646 RepID=UPI00289D022C|nr:hypothetical protein [Chryseobacterium binzhouense]